MFAQMRKRTSPLAQSILLHSMLSSETDGETKHDDLKTSNYFHRMTEPPVNKRYFAVDCQNS